MSLTYKMFPSRLLNFHFLPLPPEPPTRCAPSFTPLEEEDGGEGGVSFFYGSLPFSLIPLPSLRLPAFPTLLHQSSPSVPILPSCFLTHHSTNPFFFLLMGGVSSVVPFSVWYYIQESMNIHD